MALRLADGALEQLVELVAERVVQLLGAEVEWQPASPYLTIPECAEFLRCSRQRVDNLLSARRLRRVKDGGRTLIARAELEAYLRGECAVTSLSPRR